MLDYEDIIQVHIELSSYCNSSCPSCPRNIDGGITDPELIPNSLSLDDVKKILSVDLLKQLKNINFCGNYGDPIMCKDMIEIVQYINEHNNTVKLAIHTNGGARNLAFWSDLGRVISTMPNAHVVFGIDGLEDTNHLYRIGVNWQKLMSNVKAYISAGGLALWDFLVFSHNEHQVEQAKALSETLGFSKFIEVSPHGFKYNGKMRVVDRQGKFLHFLEQSNIKTRPVDVKMLFDKVDFDLTVEDIKQTHNNIRKSVRDAGHFNYQNQRDRFAAMDSIEIQNCMSVRFSEIYIDSNGGIHPCCFLGHINQDSSPIPELEWHKHWIETTIGIENINSLNKPIKEIMDSYFPLIKESWTKTFAQGRNPMCALKCGIQRPMGHIRS